ncbi:MAG: hypothetical protein ACREJ2_11300 [Planctomycetota bacterium]
MNPTSLPSQVARWTRRHGMAIALAWAVAVAWAILQTDQPAQVAWNGSMPEGWGRVETMGYPQTFRTVWYSGVVTSQGPPAPVTTADYHRTALFTKTDWNGSALAFDLALGLLVVVLAVLLGEGAQRAWRRAVQVRSHSRPSRPPDDAVPDNLPADGAWDEAKPR